MAKEDIDMIDPDDADDELESAGMHLIGDDADDEDDEGAEVAPLAVSKSSDEDETPKDGLAELEELEKSMDAERNGGYDDEDPDEGI
jgi:hypothetical protein